jgi:WS/DGAT/MGAT family acyltransferase
VQPQLLDRTRPLWELYVVEGLARSRFALIAKTHLAMVDGVHAVDLAHLLLDDTAALMSPPPDTWRPTPEPTALELISGALAEAIRRPSLLMEGVRAGVPDARTVATQLARGTGLLWRAGAATTSYQSPINVEVSGQRRFAAVDTQLSAYRAIRTYYTHGGRTRPNGQADHQTITVNDVVLAVLAGALRSWLLARGEDVYPGMALTILSPQSVQDPAARSLTTPHPAGPQLANLAGVLVDLPVGEPNAAVRLQHVAFSARHGAEGVRGIPAGQLAGVAGYASGTMHAVAARLATQLTRHLFNAVVTNVPGPQQHRYLAGARLRATYPVVPLAPWQGLSVGISSYRGRIHFGLNADFSALPDLDLLATCVQEALAELVGTVPR